MKRPWRAAALLAAGLCIAGLQCGLVTRQYEVYSPKIGEGEGLRLVLLSDLHSVVYAPRQQPLLERIAALQPDAIALCGDLVDDKRAQDGAWQLLEALPEIAPCFYVSGNHEWWSGQMESIFARLQACGVTVLRGDSRRLTKGGTVYCISGIDDPASAAPQGSGYGSAAAYRCALQGLAGAEGSEVGILLAHRPEYIEAYAALPFDLALCGHAHGGQWRIPYLLNGLLAPGQGFFPQYAGGQYECGRLTAIVSRGLVRDWKPRFFNPPEVVLVELSPTR